MKHAIRLGDSRYDVALSKQGHRYRLHWSPSEDEARSATASPPSDVQQFVFEIEERLDGRLILQSLKGEETLEGVVHGDMVYLHHRGRSYQLEFQHALQRLAGLLENDGLDQIKANMPGSLISRLVEPGQEVSAGDVLLVMESMKMETRILAPHAGVVSDIFFDVGQSFDKDAVLLSLDPLDADQ